MSGNRTTQADGSLFADFPENLTHCCDCGQPFREPVENWDDYFVEPEDASFWCETCAERNSDEMDGRK